MFCPIRPRLVKFLLRTTKTPRCYSLYRFIFLVPALHSLFPAAPEPHPNYKCNPRLCAQLFTKFRFKANNFEKTIQCLTDNFRGQNEVEHFHPDFLSHRVGLLRGVLPQQRQRSVDAVQQTTGNKVGFTKLFLCLLVKHSLKPHATLYKKNLIWCTPAARYRHGNQLQIIFICVRVHVLCIERLCQNSQKTLFQRSSILCARGSLHGLGRGWRDGRRLLQGEHYKLINIWKRSFFKISFEHLRIVSSCSSSMACVADRPMAKR
jgi:hypothetical protein